MAWAMAKRRQNRYAPSKSTKKGRGGGGKQPCLPSRSPKRLDDVCVHKCGGLSRGGVPVVRRGGVALVA